MCGEVRRERSHHSQSNTLVNLGLSPPITAGSLILDPESGFPVYHLWKPEPDWVGAGEAGALPFDASSTNQKPGFPAGGKYIHVSFELSFCLSLLLSLCCYCVVIISFPIGRHFNQSEKIIPSWRERSPGVWAANVTPQLAKGKIVQNCDVCDLYIFTKTLPEWCWDDNWSYLNLWRHMHHVLPVGSVTNLVTRWRHLYCRIAWECPSDIIN